MCIRNRTLIILLSFYFFLIGRFSIFSKSIIKTSKIYSKLTTEIAGWRQCRCTGIFTVTFNCLLVIIFPLNTLGIIEICQTFSSSVFFDSVEEEDKPANQRDLARQMKHHVRVDTGTDELCLICVITCSNSSKLIWAWLVNFSFTLSVLLSGLHSGNANYRWLELNTSDPILAHIARDKLILFVSSSFLHCRAGAKAELACLVRKCG